MDPGAAARFSPGKKDDDPRFNVLPENHDAVQVFLACATQWRWISGLKAIRQGLRYDAVESVMRMMAIADPADTFQRLRVLEDQVLTCDKDSKD